jgi:hypothetical protein
LKKKFKIKKKEEAVLQSEKRYHYLTEVSPWGIFRMDVARLPLMLIPVVSYFRTVISRSFRMVGRNAVHDDDKAAIINRLANETTINKKMSEYRLRPDGKIAWSSGTVYS